MRITEKRLAELLAKVSPLTGVYAEIGVYKGATFRMLAADAARRGVVAHGFDSFQGMDDPTDMDGPNYPKGRLSCGGIEWFAQMMRRTGIAGSAYRLHEGFIPRCFDRVPKDQRFRFALVDVDQYQPTLAALRWLWPRMSPGGVVVCDDYFPGASKYASAAIDAFVKDPDGPYRGQVFSLDKSQLILEAA